MIPKDKKYIALKKNTFYMLIGTFGSKFISFLMLPLYTSWLTVKDYGFTDIIGVYSSLLVTILTLSLHESIFVFPCGHNRIKQSLYFTTGIKTIIYIALTTITFCIPITFIINALEFKSSFTDNLWYIISMYIITSIQTYVQQFCRSINKIKIYCYSGIIYTASTALFSFLLIPQYGVLGFVSANILSNGISLLYIITYGKIYKYFILNNWNLFIFKQMIKYSIPLIPNTLMWWILSAINRPIIDKYLGIEAIGIFAIANKFPTILIAITTIFSSSWQVSVLQEYGKPQFNIFYNQIGRIYIQCTILCSCLLCIFSPWIVDLVTTKSYHNAWHFIPIMVIAVIFQNIANHVGTIFSATKKSKYFLYSSLAGAITSVLFNLLLIPLYGLYGAAISIVLSQFVIASFRIYYCNQIIKLKGLKSNILLLFFNLTCVVLMEKNLYKYAFITCLITIMIFFLFQYKTHHQTSNIKIRQQK